MSVTQTIVASAHYPTAAAIRPARPQERRPVSQTTPPRPTTAPDALTLDQLVRDHYADVARTVRRLLAWTHGDAVDDVTQDVFLAALKNLPRFRGDSSPRTWLTAIAIRRCRSERRKWWKRRRTTDVTDIPTGACLPPDDTAEAVRAAVRQLPLAEREVVVLYYLEELPAADVAAVLNTTANAVNVRLHRARKHLGHLLAGLNEDH